MILRETEVLVYKTCLSATFSTTNPNMQAWDWSWVSTMIGCQLTAWTMKQAVKMLITVWVCSVITTCNLTHSVWLSRFTCPCTDRLCTHPVPHCMCVKCPSSHITVTSGQVTSIHKQLYRQWINIGTMSQPQPQNLKTQTVPLQIANATQHNAMSEIRLVL
jgi:hypothetical protein